MTIENNETLSTMPDDDGGVSDSSTDTDESNEDTGSEEGSANNGEIDADSSADSQNTDNSEDEASDDDLTDEEKAAAEEARVAEESKRFDQNPRFKKLIAEKNQQANQIKELEAKLAAEPGNTRDFDAEKQEIKDKLSSGDINLDEYSTEIQKLVNEEAQLEADAKQAAIDAAAAQEANTKAFLEENPYIDLILTDRADDVELLVGSNPVHDKVTAAMALHIEDLTNNNQKAIDEAVEKAVKEAQVKFEKSAKSKRRAVGLDKGGRSVDGDEKPITGETPGDLRKNIAESLDNDRQAS